MVGLISLILPIFLLIGLGYGAVRGRIVTAGVAQAISAFVMNFALPALILHALLQQDLRQTLSWGYLAAYGAGSLVTLGVLVAVARLVMRRPAPRAAMAALGGCASNSVFVGFPVASLALGASALTALPLSLLVENILIIPLAMALAESATVEGRGLASILRQTLARMARTPFIIAIFLGALLAAAGVRPPAALARTLDMLADAAVPCALFVVGATLAGLKPGSGMLGDVWFVVAGKLVLHPLLVVAAFLLVGNVPAELMAAGIIMASAPMLTIYPIICARFGEEQMGAAALLATTAASFFTLLAVLAMLGLAGPG